MSPKGSERLYTFVINGVTHQVEIKNNTLLLDLLRERFGLYSVREGCGAGACGTCTVLIDGQPISSCLKLAATLPSGSEITTVEGLANGDTLDPVQEAFIEAGAFQCAFCTSGMILAVRALLEEDPRPTEEEAREYLNGHYCRCGAYPEILQAIGLLADK